MILKDAPKALQRRIKSNLGHADRILDIFVVESQEEYENHRYMVLYSVNGKVQQTSFSLGTMKVKE